jgi:hypothetical protein
MPDAAAGAQHGNIDGDGSPAGGPGLDQIKQMPTQTANLGWQRVRKGYHAPFPGATRWELSLLTESLALSPHFCGRLG